MPLFTPVATLQQATQRKPGWEVIPDFKSKGREVEVEGKKYQIFNKKERATPLIWRILVIASSILLFAIPLLFSKRVRGIFFDGKETVRFAVPKEALQPIESDEPHITKRLEPLYREIDIARTEDTLSPPNTWKKGLGSEEVEETLESFNQDRQAVENVGRRKVNIIFLGPIRDEDRRIVRIVADYLNAVHGVTVNAEERTLELDESRKREREGATQYSAYFQLHAMAKITDRGSYSLGFTNEDIYPGVFQPNVNFLYGLGGAPYASGIFSTHRLSSGTMEKTVVRLMKLASHEFAHMRGLAHCTDYVCGVQGINNLSELDHASLAFCSQDMAKICLVNGWSLKEGYSRQLQFFKDFSVKFGIPCDFREEITLLQRKIRKLESVKKG